MRQGVRRRVRQKVAKYQPVRFKNSDEAGEMVGVNAATIIVEDVQAIAKGERTRATTKKRGRRELAGRDLIVTDFVVFSCQDLDD